MNSSIFKKIQPHLIAVLVFLVISVVYFSPVLSGSSLEQHDVAQWTGMSKEIVDFKAKTGEEALWTNSMFSGMPAYQISVTYSHNLVKYVNNFLWLWLPTPANILFLSLIGFYLLAISFKADYRLAIALAIAYAFCSFNFVSIMAGHNTKVHAIALMPMVLAGVMLAFRGRILWGAALTALALSLQIYANHLQITYYLAMSIGLLAIFEGVNAVMQKRIADYLKAGVALGFAAVLAVLPNITNLWATSEYGQYSTRGPSELTEKKISTGLDKDYALGWSYGKLETLTLLMSDFNGGASQYDLGEKSATYEALRNNTNESTAKSFVKTAPLYWGDQPMTSGPVYNGAIPVFLFVLALLLLNGYMRWWIIAVAALSIMLSWGRHFLPLTDFFFDHVPAYNKFRSVSMTLVLVSMMIPLAGLLGVLNFTDDKNDLAKRNKSLKLAFYITGGLCLLMVIFPNILCDFKGEGDKQLEQYDWLLAALRKDRESILRLDAFRSFFFISIGFGLLWAWINKKIKKEILFAGLAFFILVDLWSVDKRYLNDSKFGSKSSASQPFQMTAADQQILQDATYYRVMNTTVSTFNDASTSYFHKSIGGYHGAKLKRYQELIERQISKGNMNVLNMLNTKYFIVNNPQDNTPAVQINQAALGNAWFVENWKVVPNADAEITELDSMNTKTTAVIDQRFADEVKGLEQNVVDSTASITLNADGYSPKELKYTSNSSKDRLAVFSEVHYPAGWNAYVDGKLTPHIRLNYVLRGMKVPAGKHEIVFKFEPKVFIEGEQIALAGSIALFLVVAGVAFMEFRKPKGEAPAKA